MSHHGKYVCIVADHHQLVGVDIVDVMSRSPNAKSSCIEYIKMFSSYLTSTELAAILKHQSDDNRLTHFYVIWSLKEAYIKAIGLGLGYDLSQISFDVQFDDSGSVRPLLLNGVATASIKGCVRGEWVFEFSALDDRHVMSIARGPIADALVSYAEAAQLRTTACSIVPECGGEELKACRIGKFGLLKVGFAQVYRSSFIPNFRID